MTTTSPMAAVLEAVESGQTTGPAAAARTGLDVDVVDAVIAHLVRMGRVGRLPTSMCASGSCHGCTFARTCSRTVERPLGAGVGRAQ